MNRKDNISLSIYIYQSCEIEDTKRSTVRRVLATWINMSMLKFRTTTNLFDSYCIVNLLHCDSKV